MTRHLGKNLYSLVDGQLDAQAVSAAMAHLDECEQCRDAWNGVRRDREALQTSGQGIDMGFARQLLDRDRIAHIAQAEPRHHARAAGGRGINVPRVLAVTGGVLLAAVTGLWALGAPHEVKLEFSSPAMVTSHNEVQVIAAPTMRAGTALVSWVHPHWDDSGIVPVGASVVETVDGRQALFAVMLLDEHRISVTEQHGTLPAAVGEVYPEAGVNDVTAYVVGDEPLRVVWETGDVVIGLECVCPLAVLVEVAEEFPEAEEPGFLERVGDGLAELADAVTGD